jgi:flagellar biosynthesis protein FlhA
MANQDVTVATPQKSNQRSSRQQYDPASLWALLQKNPDLLVGFGVMFILALLIIPLPGFLLDIILAINITLSVLILMVSIYIKSPLDISSFPTVLLITTLLRLGLNIASTRLILSQGQAGDIIKGFGTFVVGGNYVVGVIIFLVLIIVNFVVIIKGSSRIAEVSARFTLDALPGKQMSIDADLNSGFIDEQEARKRRKNLGREAEFFGAMDGASKFVKGDAIAGLIITAINIIGGFTIGIAQKGMTFQNSLSTYTILTIGDGLVSQIPALLISVAAGLVVTRSASGEALESELGMQFGKEPRALAISSGALFLFALIPGFPIIPFVLLGSIAGTIAYFRYRAINEEKRLAIIQEIQALPPSNELTNEEQPVEDLLFIDPIEIELGYGLIPLVDQNQGGDVFKRITNIRRQLATELGFILPPVRVRDNLQLDPEEYVIKVRSNEFARNKLYPGRLLAMNPGSAEGNLRGLKVTEPVFSLPATWIMPSDREHAEIMGFTVVEPATVLATHLTEILRRNAERLLTRQEVRQLLDNVKKHNAALIDEVTNEQLPISIVQKVLQNLLRELIPIRDMPIILESLLEYVKVTQNVEVLTEYVRHNLSETIKRLYQDHNGVIHAASVAPRLEQAMVQTLQQNPQASTMPSLGFSPQVLEAIYNSVTNASDELTLSGYSALIICPATIRPYLFRMLHGSFPMINIISFTEIPSDSELEIIATIDY